jgi:hypothetical protein
MLIGLDLVAVDANSCGLGCKIRSEKLSKAELVRSRISTSSHVGSSRQARCMSATISLKSSKPGLLDWLGEGSLNLRIALYPLFLSRINMFDKCHRHSGTSLPEHHKKGPPMYASIPNTSSSRQYLVCSAFVKD